MTLCNVYFLQVSKLVKEENSFTMILITTHILRIPLVIKEIVVIMVIMETVEITELGTMGTTAMVV